ncbi:MAG: molecular chaperone TorD family protein [Acidobacteria bacterium]|nr:molecular chaperone TorD family protein [Acidobacteriota bacterium]
MGRSKTKTQWDTPQPCDQALCRSVFYGTLSLALHTPTLQIFNEVRSKRVRRALQQAAQLLSSCDLPEGREIAAPDSDPIDLSARVTDWIKSFRSVSLDRLLSAHGRLFGHTARGVVCPYEAEYGHEGLFQQPRQLAKIEGFYQAFGLTTRKTEHERSDHVSCELEFLDFLSRKEAFALAAGDAAMLEETRKAIRLFLKDHVGRFGMAFARLLQKQDEGFFGKLGELLYGFVTFECRRLGIEAGPPLLQLRPAEEDGVPMACGAQSELVQLQTPQ